VSSCEFRVVIVKLRPSRIGRFAAAGVHFRRPARGATVGCDQPLVSVRQRSAGSTEPSQRTCDGRGRGSPPPCRV